LPGCRSRKSAGWWTETTDARNRRPQIPWSAPGSMDTQEGGCNMRPEVLNDFGEETAEDLHA